MADYNITAVTRRKTYSGSAGVGPYAFTFPVIGQTDIAVYKNSTLLTLTTNYTVTVSPTNGTGSVTLVVAATTPDQITIVGARTIQRTTDFLTAGDLTAASLNEQLDGEIIMVQQIAEENKRTIKAPVFDPEAVEDGGVLNMTLPVSASRATKVLAFDASGNPISSTLTITAIESQAAAAAASATAAASSASAAASSASAASTSATNASTSATSSASSAASASSSAATAAATLASGLYSAVQDKSTNYTVVSGDAGDLLRVTTTSGAITITLPTISTVSDGFKVAIVKWSADANAVTIARSGADTINGALSASVGQQYTQTTFVADFETNQWFASTSGLGATNVVVDSFNGTGSQTAFTLSGDPNLENNTYVYVSGVYQSKATYSLSGTVLTFSSAPPSGTANIEVVWTQPLSVGTPSDGTVTPAKLSTGGPSWDAFGNLTASGYVAGATGLLYPVGLMTVNAGAANPFSAAATITGVSFLPIPSWAKRISVIFSAFSTNGASNYLIQVGSGSVSTSGYAGTVSNVANAVVPNTFLFPVLPPSGFLVNTAGAGNICHGILTICLVSGATYVGSGVFAHSSTSNVFSMAGSITLPGVLDRVFVTTVTSVDLFDAGSINVQYE